MGGQESNFYCGGNGRHGCVAVYHSCLICSAIGSPVQEDSLRGSRWSLCMLYCFFKLHTSPRAFWHAYMCFFTGPWSPYLVITLLRKKYLLNNIRHNVGLIFQGAPSHRPSRPPTILIPQLGPLDKPLTGLALKRGLRRLKDLKMAHFLAKI